MRGVSSWTKCEADSWWLSSCARAREPPPEESAPPPTCPEDRLAPLAVDVVAVECALTGVWGAADDEEMELEELSLTSGKRRGAPEADGAVRSPGDLPLAESDPSMRSILRLSFDPSLLGFLDDVSDEAESAGLDSER